VLVMVLVFAKMVSLEILVQRLSNHKQLDASHLVQVTELAIHSGMNVNVTLDIQDKIVVHHFAQSPIVINAMVEEFVIKVPQVIKIMNVHVIHALKERIVL